MAGIERQMMLEELQPKDDESAEKVKPEQSGQVALRSHLVVGPQSGRAIDQVLKWSQPAHRSDVLGFQYTTQPAA